MRNLKGHIKTAIRLSRKIGGDWAFVKQMSREIASGNPEDENEEIAEPVIDPLVLARSIKNAKDFGEYALCDECYLVKIARGVSLVVTTTEYVWFKVIPNGARNYRIADLARLLDAQRWELWIY